MGAWRWVGLALGHAGGVKPRRAFEAQTSHARPGYEPPQTVGLRGPAKTSLCPLLWPFLVVLAVALRRAGRVGSVLPLPCCKKSPQARRQGHGQRPPRHAASGKPNRRLADFEPRHHRQTQAPSAPKGAPPSGVVRRLVAHSGRRIAGNAIFASMHQCMPRVYETAALGRRRCHFCKLATGGRLLNVSRATGRCPEVRSAGRSDP